MFTEGFQKTASFANAKPIVSEVAGATNLLSGPKAPLKERLISATKDHFGRNKALYGAGALGAAGGYIVGKNRE